MKSAQATAGTSRHLAAWFFATVSVLSVAAHIMAWRALASFAAEITPLGVVLILAGIPAAVAGYVTSSREPEYLDPGAVSVVCFFLILLAWLAFGGVLLLHTLSSGGA